MGIFLSEENKSTDERRKEGRAGKGKRGKEKEREGRREEKSRRLIFFRRQCIYLGSND